MITPAYPASNSSYSVSSYTLEVMKKEFARASDIIDTILCENPTNEWDKLFEPSDFFIKYEQYIRCDIIGIGDDAVSRSWISYVESRIRHILPALAMLPVKSLHFYPKFSKTTHSDNSICYFIGFDVDRLRCRGKEIRIDYSVKQFT